MSDLTAVTPHVGVEAEVGKDPSFASTIVGLLSDSPSPALSAGVQDWISNWTVQNWEDLACYKPEDFEEYVKEAVEGDTSGAIFKPPHVLGKKIRLIIAYAPLGLASPTVTMMDVITAINGPSSSRSSTPTVQFAEQKESMKKVVPDLEKFSGRDEDYFAWRDSTINKLGQAGLAEYLTNVHTVVSNKDLSHGVFYAIRTALQDGTAVTLSTALFDKKDYDPSKLWSDLDGYYDTSVNRANVVLFDIKKLLNLQLTADVEPTTFISDFQAALLRLKKHDAKLAEDNDTLRALLLVAIQDDEFETTRDLILKEPDKTVEDVLKDLRMRDTSLQIKDSARDSDAKIRARRTQKVSTFKGGATGHQDSTIWRIPRFPNSWKEAFGKKFFDILLHWRNAALQRRFTQSQLDEEYALVTEKVQSNNQSNLSRKRKSYARRAGGQQHGSETKLESELRRKVMVMPRLVVTMVHPALLGAESD
jgi:hypothetical protein